MNPQAFARGTALGIVLIGALAFAALLYWLGTGTGPTNNGGAHVAGRGLNGYAALAAMLEADGITVRRARSKAALHDPGLLVLTPPADARGEDIAEIVRARSMIGPTMIVAPKWIAVPEVTNPAMRRGWTKIVGTEPPRWEHFHDDIGVGFGKAPAGGWQTAGQHGGRRGRLPQDRQVQAGNGPGMQALIETHDGRVLAAYLPKDGANAAIDGWIGVEPVAATGRFPVVLVFEPDLLDNWGLADRATGLVARDLLLVAAGGRGADVTFDLTLNGLGATRNLLTLAFEPPFLAATLCLAMALLAAGWRGFNRFGPPRQPLRAIPLGKTVLVTNTAGLIRRAGRLRLIAGPYADGARERLVLALGLPRGRPAGETDAAIDRLQARSTKAGPTFSEVSAQLRAAHRSADVMRSAAALQRIEKDMIQ